MSLYKQQKGFSLIEIILALAVSSLLCVSLFQYVQTVELLHQRQLTLASLEAKTRFLTIFLRQKIQMSGDFSCEPNREIPTPISVMQRYSSNAAKEILGIPIKTDTALLQLLMCVHIQGQLQYLPVSFFVANTGREDSQGRSIDALFMKIATHPREALLEDVVDFQATLENTAVKLNYALLQNNISQSGEIYVARRAAIA